ncbi:uncharacterized mitochondrial protein AtMg00860-like [Solanum lycopersicum]|uniref:uncharacterized mitochondrial protein AtMg00860-like n=1 Tax=Solanum lycopersicum TaxID=4081 RepID=UPI0002BC8BC8|nr:uncharacterized protein LOC109120696 [Solanum lycopersicum]
MLTVESADKALMTASVVVRSGTQLTSAIRKEVRLDVTLSLGLIRRMQQQQRLLRGTGHVLSDKGVKVNARKTEAVKNWPKPLTPTDNRSFLELVGYYRRLMEGFSSIVTSLIALTKKKAMFEWIETFEKILQ